MKIIFNHNIHDWWWQIYDEWSKNHKIILPDNYRTEDKNISVDFDALEKVSKENSDSDFIFSIENGLYDLIEWEKRNINIPIVWLSTNAINRPHVAKISVFAKLWYVEKYAKLLMEKYNLENLIYEGMAANQYIFYPKSIKKVYDIGFFGQHYGERGYWLNIIKKFCLKNGYKFYSPKGDGSNLVWTYDDINTFYNQTKINLSFSPKNTLGRIVNLRTFEICMSGNFQLMQYSPCIEEYFELDKEIVCWKNEKDLREKIAYFLTNEDEREKIAMNGYNKAISNHTWTIRLEKIKSFLNKPKNNINKYILKIDQLIDKYKIDEIQKFKSLNPNQCYNELIKPILEFHRYKLKSDLKKKTDIEVNSTYKYRVNKKDIDTYFITFFNKTIMIIGVLASNSEISLRNWNDFKKIIYLTENKDLSSPQFGILTNGFKWIIRDFKNRKWLKYIPNRRELKSSLNLNRYLAIIMVNHILDFLSPFQIRFIRTIKRKIELLKWMICYKRISF